MRGTLHKTEQGWIVEYAKHSQLPLHPDELKMNEIYFNELLKDGNEVEFEIVKKVPSEHDVTHGTFVVYKNYAKLISSKEQQLVQIDQDNPATVDSTALVDKQEVDDMLAKEDLFTEKQVRQAMFEAYVECENGNNFFNVQDKIIQLIKKHKK
jgi:phosphoribosylformylglycinamidine (FGAM) synthase-like enzyme